MNLRAVFLLLMGGIGLPAVAHANNAAPSRDVIAAYLLAFGRLPAAHEATFADATASLERTVAALKSRLVADAAESHATLTRSYRDAFGRAPTDEEANAGALTPRTYTELMIEHLARLAAAPIDYEQVIRRAYPLVIRRDAYPEEIEYWRKHGPLPYALIVACIDNWARRNQPGLMVTTGKPTIALDCPFLTAVRLEPEAGDAARPIVNPGAATNDGRKVIAVGGEKVSSNGAVVFIAAGNEQLLESHHGTGRNRATR